MSKGTLISAQSATVDHTIAWINECETTLSFEPSIFGIVGGVINTNSGIILTKEQLLEIASKMTDKSELRICGTNKPFTKEALKESGEFCNL